MADEYQRGTDDQWLAHSNQELTRLAKKHERTIGVLKFGIVVLIILLGWVTFKFTRHAELRELWTLQAGSSKNE